MPSQLGKMVEKEYCTKYSARQASEANLPKGVTVMEVDYDDPASLAKALQGVHTVISFLAIFDIQKFASTQIKLVDACIANGVKRFAPSEWAT